MSIFKKIAAKIIKLFSSRKPTVNQASEVEHPETPKTSQPDRGGTSTPDFDYLWSICQVDQERITEISNVCFKIKQNKHRYLEVQIATGVPWFLIAALHYREASLNFNTVLHNGEKLDDVNRRGTTWVPKGRGKGKNWTWEDAAIDALIYDKVHKADLSSIPKCLKKAEAYNGMGYRKTGEYSPYVWAGTNIHDETGKYVADGKFSKTAQERQLGVAAILKGLSL